MKHELLLLGKTRETFIAQGIEDYVSRLQHYTRLSTLVLKEKKHAGAAGHALIDAEGDLFLNATPPGALIVALDVAGKQVSSEEFAGIIDSWEQRGVKSVSYIIGGFLGISQKVLDQADLCLSLSRMTFTHDMARLLLVEQLYRAYTIKAGEKYHK
jgi:23S rRNA (pseudouridine1915-N3)-methyltransferase